MYNEDKTEFRDPADSTSGIRELENQQVVLQMHVKNVERSKAKNLKVEESAVMKGLHSNENHLIYLLIQYHNFFYDANCTSVNESDQLYALVNWIRLAPAATAQATQMSYGCHGTGKPTSGFHRQSSVVPNAINMSMPANVKKT